MTTKGANRRDNRNRSGKSKDNCNYNGNCNCNEDVIRRCSS